MNSPLLSSLIAATLFSVTSASAKTDWSKQFLGLDGVVLSCVDHSDGNYGKRLCDTYLKAIASDLSKAGVPFENLGHISHDDDQTVEHENLKRPLNLKLFIRGTAGSQVAIQLRARASVTYSAAIERGSAGEGRSGELVIWERATTGSGPSKQLQPAIVEAMQARTASLIKQLKKNWK